MAKHFAAEQVAFRNLAVAADEVATWHRSQEFGSRNEWLTWTQADVIFAFYGFNESFKGTAGVEKFKADLTEVSPGDEEAELRRERRAARGALFADRGRASSRCKLP